VDDFFDIELDLGDIGTIDIPDEDLDIGPIDLDLGSIGLEEDEEERDSGYSPVRGGLAAFGEAALGIGDELDAFARMASDGLSYSDAIKEARRNIKRF